VRFPASAEYPTLVVVLAPPALSAPITQLLRTSPRLDAAYRGVVSNLMPPLRRDATSSWCR